MQDASLSGKRPQSPNALAEAVSLASCFSAVLVLCNASHDSTDLHQSCWQNCRTILVWSTSTHIRLLQVPMFSASGLRVQYLKVWEKSNYRVDKWVRKVCKSGDYNIRL